MLYCTTPQFFIMERIGKIEFPSEVWKTPIINHYTICATISKVNYYDHLLTRSGNRSCYLLPWPLYFFL